jgi:hypothetical protein
MQASYNNSKNYINFCKNCTFVQNVWKIFISQHNIFPRAYNALKVGHPYIIALYTCNGEAQGSYYILACAKYTPTRQKCLFFYKNPTISWWPFLVYSMSFQLGQPH